MSREIQRFGTAYPDGASAESTQAAEDAAAAANTAAARAAAAADEVEAKIPDLEAKRLDAERHAQQTTAFLDSEGEPYAKGARGWSQDAELAKSGAEAAKGGAETAKAGAEAARTQAENFASQAQFSGYAGTYPDRQSFDAAMPLPDGTYLVKDDETAEGRPFAYMVGSGSIVASWGTIITDEHGSARVVDRGGAVVNVKAFGAKGDGSANDRDAISAAVAAAPASGVVLLPPGRYRLAGPQLVISRPDVTIQGYGATIDLSDYPGTTPIMVTEDNVGMEGITFDAGERAPSNSVSGPRFEQVNRASLIHCTWVGFRAGNGVAIRGGFNHVVAGCRYFGVSGATSGYAVHLWGVGRTVVSNNIINDVGYNGIAVYNGSSDVVVEGNKCHGNGHSPIAVSPGGKVVIVGNHCTATSDGSGREAGIEVEIKASHTDGSIGKPTRNVIVVGNFVSDNEIGIVVRRWEGSDGDPLERVSVIGNYFHNNAVGLKLTYGTDVYVDANHIPSTNNIPLLWDRDECSVQWGTNFIHGQGQRLATQNSDALHDQAMVVASINSIAQGAQSLVAGSNFGYAHGNRSVVLGSRRVVLPESDAVGGGVGPAGAEPNADYLTWRIRSIEGRAWFKESVRVTPVARNSLGSASILGAGAVRVVTNPEAGKGRVVVSDGTDWRYISDDSVVS